MTDVIYLVRATELDPFDGKALWWDNEGGWGDLGNALVFTREEVAECKPPLGGQWVRFEEMGEAPTGGANRDSEWLVTWEIDVTADSETEAAMSALATQVGGEEAAEARIQDPDSATCFTLRGKATGDMWRVDLARNDGAPDLIIRGIR